MAHGGRAQDRQAEPDVRAERGGAAEREVRGDGGAGGHDRVDGADHAGAHVVPGLGGAVGPQVPAAGQVLQDEAVVRGGLLAVPRHVQGGHAAVQRQGAGSVPVGQRAEPMMHEHRVRAPSPCTAIHRRAIDAPSAPSNCRQPWTLFVRPQLRLTPGRCRLPRRTASDGCCRSYDVDAAGALVTRTNDHLYISFFKNINIECLPTIRPVVFLPARFEYLYLHAAACFQLFSGQTISTRWLLVLENR